ncbi:hypothetical protein B6J67_28325 [Klebsiella quasipneumoniae]|nr:hypothetical protein B6J67_28325 [Klebsiella quasipneumoniae]PLJ64242.1 hypothetical protein B6J68_08575 [Klebsiella quasipneumoniae]
MAEMAVNTGIPFIAQYKMMNILIPAIKTIMFSKVLIILFTLWLLVLILNNTAGISVAIIISRDS